MIKVRKADKATQRTSRCNSDPGSNRFDLAIMRASRLNMRLHVREFFKQINEKSTNPIFWSVMPITNRGFSVRQRPARRGIDDRNEWTDLPRDVPRARHGATTAALSGRFPPWVIRVDFGMSASCPVTGHSRQWRVFGFAV